MFQDTVVFAVTKFPKSRQLPYPLPWNPLRIMGYYFCPRSIAFAYQLFIFWILPAGLVGLAWVALIRLLRDELDRPRMAACALAGAAAVLFLMVAVRPVGMRVSGSVVLGLLSFAAFSGDRSRWVRGAARLLLIGSVVAYVPYGAAWVWGQRAYGVELLCVRGGVYSELGHATMIDVASGYVADHTSPSERIFSGDPVIYFTAARDAATKYYEPHPLLTDTPEIQRIIIRDIEREHVRYFVRSREWVVDGGWFTIEPDHQPRMLIRYIQSNYEIVPYFNKPEIRDSRLLVYRRKTPFGHRLSKETL